MYIYMNTHPYAIMYIYIYMDCRGVLCLDGSFYGQELTFGGSCNQIFGFTQPKLYYMDCNIWDSDIGS